VAILYIPCTPGGESHWTQRTQIDGRDYILTFWWSQRAGRWSLDVADAEGGAIVSGRVLVPAFSALRGVRDPRRAAGEIGLVDMQSGGGTGLTAVDDPTFSSLGTRHVLVYVDGEDLP